MSWADDIKTGLRSLREHVDDGWHPTTCTYKGTEYPCIAVSHRSGLDVVVGGKSENVTFSLIISKEDWPWNPTADGAWPPVDSGYETADGGSNPAASKKITYRGTDYRIAEVIETSGNTAWQVDLISPSR